MTDSTPQSRHSSIKCEEGCPFHRIGLPIFPVRYAAVLNNQYSPQLAGDLAAADVVDKKLGASGRYGVRLLRPGYLYLYDEARQVLEGYFVGEKNTLYKFDVDKPMNIGDSQFTCTMDHQATASLLTIPNAAKATKVWLAFSDVQWTKAVCDKHRGANGAAERKQHMFEFNVQAWLAAKTHKNARKIVGMRSMVAEYYAESRRDLDMYGKMQQFDWSTVSFISRQTWMGEMIETAAEHFAPGKGLMLALPDPAGIAQDIARLMRKRFDEFTTDPHDVRQLTVSKSIESLREIVADKAETDFLNQGEHDAVNMEIYGTTSPSPGDGGMALGQVLADKLFPANRQQRMAQADHYRHPSDTERTKVRTDAWNKYLQDYNESARTAWQQDFDRKLKDFDVNNIVPLATAHAAWMQGPHMLGSFQCNFDPKDADSGDVYLTLLTLCMDGTQDKRACFELYEKWLKGDPLDTRNLLLRAMLHNQDLIAQNVADATATTVDWKAIPWGKLQDIYATALKRLAKGAVDKTARLVEQSLGPLVRVLNAGADSPMARRLAVMMGVISHSPVQIVNVTGSKKKFRAALIREVLRQHGGQVDQRKMESAVADELRRLEVAGEPIDGTDKKRWFRLVDSEAAAAVPKTGTPAERAGALAETTMSIEDYEAREMSRWRTVISSDVRVGSVSCVFQGVFLYKLWSDVQSSMPHERSDATWKLVVGIASTGGSFAEVLGNAMAGRAILGMRLGSGLALETAGNLVARFGGRIGVITGVVMAFFDFKSAKDQLSVEHNGLMGGLYLASGVLSIAVLLAFAAASSIVGIVLVVALIIITVLIEIFKDNKVQDWLKRAYWGKFQDKEGTGYYNGIQEEMNNLHLALGGN